MNAAIKVLGKIVSQVMDEDTLDRLISEQMGYYQAEHFRNPPKPKEKINHVGIEIECYSYLERDETYALMLKHDLEEYLNIYDDGTIEAPGYQDSYEFRVLSTEKELPQVLEKLGKFFKEGKFKVNSSCGLHVHLDMRYRDVRKCYQKLVDFQDILFGLVSPRRWTNEFCEWSDPTRNQWDRFCAINYTAFAVHKTLEVRLHHGSVDTVKIGAWIQLLLRAIKDKKAPKITSKAAAVKWAKGKEQKEYIKEHFQKSWFSRKTKVMRGVEREY